MVIDRGVTVASDGPHRELQVGDQWGIQMEPGQVYQVRPVSMRGPEHLSVFV